MARLIWAGILNIAIAALEFIGGLLSGSLSIMTDALRNFTHAGAVGVRIVALKLNDKPKDLKIYLWTEKGTGNSGNTQYYNPDLDKPFPYQRNRCTSDRLVTG